MLKLPRLKHVLLASALGALCLAPAPARAGAPVVLRIASLAPEGSSWMKLFHQFQKKVEERTAKRVTFKFYPGGLMGDEKDMLRKIKLGQLHGAGITGIGLSAIDPEVRTIEVARTYEELDGLRKALGPMLEKRFEAKGYILLGWGDVGPVRFFSNRPIRTLDDMRANKTWLWNEDPISKQLFEALQLRGVSMGVPDVLPALTTHTVDAFFGSPLSTVALQWGGYVKFVTSLVMTQATGAVVISKKAFDQIAPEDQAILREEGRAMEAQVLRQVRDDNTKALAALKSRGIEEVATPAELTAALQKQGDAVAEKIGKTFSKEMQDAVRKILDASGRK